MSAAASCADDARGSARRPRRAASLLVALCVLASLAVGSRSIPLAEVVAAFTRLRRTATPTRSCATCACRGPSSGCSSAAALGAAGALMQGTTRNPLAEPGILGINAGAAFAVVSRSRRSASRRSPATRGSRWLGAGVDRAARLRARRGGPRRARRRSGSRSPARCSRAAHLAHQRGARASTPQTLDEFRFWIVGSIAGPRRGRRARGRAVHRRRASRSRSPPGRWLNALALGDDVARSLGQRVGRTRAARGARVRAARRRRGRRRRADRVRRPRRAARRARARRARLPLDRARTASCSARSCCSASDVRRAASSRGPPSSRSGSSRRCSARRSSSGSSGAAARGAVSRRITVRAGARLPARSTCAAARRLAARGRDAGRARAQRRRRRVPVAPLDVLAALVGAGDEATSFIVARPAAAARAHRAARRRRARARRRGLPGRRAQPARRARHRRRRRPAPRSPRSR